MTIGTVCSKDKDLIRTFLVDIFFSDTPVGNRLVINSCPFIKITYLSHLWSDTDQGCSLESSEICLRRRMFPIQKATEEMVD